MDDFNSFVNHTDQREEANNAPPADLSRLIRQLAGKYNGANEAELMQAIYKEAERAEETAPFRMPISTVSEICSRPCLTTRSAESSGRSFRN